MAAPKNLISLVIGSMLMVCILRFQETSTYIGHILIICMYVCMYVCMYILTCDVGPCDVDL